MLFPTPLVQGRLIKRYKRFLADVELENGEIVTAHSVNTGSMLGVLDPGNEVWLSRADNPKRKLAYTWELVRAGKELIGINTSMANLLTWEALREEQIPELSGYEYIRKEVKYGANSRIDFLLSGSDRPDCYVEVKNVHLKRDRHAEFPDTVSQRAAKHMEELGNMVKQGKRAVVLFIVQRNDVEGFKVAADIDPAYNHALETALDAGVEALSYSFTVTPSSIALARKLPITRIPCPETIEA